LFGHDDPTDVVLGWLINDPDNFNYAVKLVAEWTDEGSTPDNILSDLESYLRETLDTASSYTRAGKCRSRLADSELSQVEWQAVLDRINDN